MQAKNYKNLVIRDLEKQIQTKMVEKFFEVNKTKDQIKPISKVGKDIHLEFISEEAAKLFIEEYNHLGKIMLKKFNISYSFFLDNQQSYHRFEVLGVTQQNRRKIYDICKSCGLCHFKITYENKKLNPSMIIYFQHIQPSQRQQLKQALQTLSIKLREEENYGDFDKFRCSIQLSNLAEVNSEILTKNEEEELNHKILELMKAISEQTPNSIQFHTYLHKQAHKAKVYFKFKTIQLTFQLYEKLRVYLLHKSESIGSRLYYFQNDANSFYTLFTTGLINSQGLSNKMFEEELLKTFRKVNPNITQILLNPSEDTFTGKIYFKNQADGKDFLGCYTKKREHYYMFYKPGTNVLIDIFQTQKQIKNKFKYQKKVNDMLDHLKYNRPKTEKPPIQPLAPYAYSKPQFKNEDFNKKEQQGYRNTWNKQNKYREKQTEYTQKNNQHQPKFREKKQETVKPETKKAEKKLELKFGEEDFPSL